ncbi:hypothetical protein D9M71_256220 [compost metagenome]
MSGQVGGGGVGEVGTDRVPVGAQQRRAQAHHHANGQLGGLAAARGALVDHLFANDHGLAGFLDMNGQGVIEQVTVLHDHPQRIAQVALVAEQQADFAEVRQLAQFGHAQAEALALAGAGGSFQQVDHAGHRDTPVGVVKQRRAEAHLCQQFVGVQTQVARHLQVVGQAGGADEGRHFLLLSLLFRQPGAFRQQHKAVATKSTWLAGARVL